MTAQLVLNGIGAAHGVGMGDPNPPHRVAQVFFAAPPWSCHRTRWRTAAWYPDLIVDITDVVEAKVAALDAMRSQQYGGDYARKTIEMVDGAMGSIGGVAYGEGFMTYLPKVTRTFPVSEWLSAGIGVGGGPDAATDASSPRRSISRTEPAARVQRLRAPAVAAGPPSKALEEPDGLVGHALALAGADVAPPPSTS